MLCLGNHETSFADFTKTEKVPSRTCPNVTIFLAEEPRMRLKQSFNIQVPKALSTFLLSYTSAGCPLVSTKHKPIPGRDKAGGGNFPNAICKQTSVRTEALRVRNFILWLTSTCLIAIATVSVFAQNTPARLAKEKEPVLGIVLDANHARVLTFVPRIKDSLLKTLQQRRKQIRLVAWDAGDGDVELVAKSKSCDSLLEIFVLEKPGEGNGDSAKLADSLSEEERDRRELASLRVEYHLRSLAQKPTGEPEFNLAEADSIRPADYSTAWDASAYETTVSRAVTRVALASMNKLPKQ